MYKSLLKDSQKDSEHVNQMLFMTKHFFQSLTISKY